MCLTVKVGTPAHVLWVVQKKTKNLPFQRKCLVWMTYERNNMAIIAVVVCSGLELLYIIITAVYFFVYAFRYKHLDCCGKGTYECTETFPDRKPVGQWQWWNNIGRSKFRVTHREIQFYFSIYLTDIMCNIKYALYLGIHKTRFLHFLQAVRHMISWVWPMEEKCIK